MTTEDEVADAVVRRGRNAGGVWIVASVSAFGIGFAARNVGPFVLAWLTGLVLFAIGLGVRARYWREARRRLGDATIQRARWRSAAAERDSPARLVGALVFVVMLLGFELWRL